MFTNKEKQTFCIFMIGGNVKIGAIGLPKLGSYPNRDCKIRTIFPSVATFERDGSQGLEKDISHL